MSRGADIITIFPEFFVAAGFGVLGQAIRDGVFELRCHDLRDHTTDRHRSTDDTPYGGGAGMVMLCEPIFRALDSVDPDHVANRILLTPRGEVLNQGIVREIAAHERLVLVCGRYEGVDERVTGRVDREISLGDFVLSGGETAALALVDAVARLVPGVLGNARSLEDESFSQGILEYPQYTRPREISGQRVPEVLFSGDHAAIARWRRGRALLDTKKRRPDLWRALSLSEDDYGLVEDAEAGST
ncbi:MAG: tRNA (guanosine(37)-N1)-methyltransferase TrmD [Deltaproteobacteria bacterium]|nr:tRNA (guanosine(37)-N1)-methyltransferase TrmD [Deltaproteobacteria bacterium]